MHRGWAPAWPVPRGAGVTAQNDWDTPLAWQCHSHIPRQCQSHIPGHGSARGRVPREHGSAGSRRRAGAGLGSFRPGRNREK